MNNPHTDQHHRHLSTHTTDPTEEIAEVDAPPTVIITPERIMVLTDGVVAIAMTLLVLDLNAVDYPGSSVAGLWRALGQHGDRFVAFFIAFWVIAQFWLAHHRVFRRVTRHEDFLAKRNFWFLFGISVLPFTTRLLGHTNDNPLPVALFSANLALVSLTLSWLTWSAERAGAAEPLTDQDQLLMMRARSVTTVTLIALPGVLAWVIQPGTAELLYLLLFLADVPGKLAVHRRKHGATGHAHNASAAR